MTELTCAICLSLYDQPVLLVRMITQSVAGMNILYAVLYAHVLQELPRRAGGSGCRGG